MERPQDLTNVGLYLPRPAYQRPVSYGQRSPTNCSHCGSLTPRYGSTTVYGTPLKHTPATSTEKLPKYTARYSSVSLSRTRYLDVMPTTYHMVSRYRDLGLLISE